MFSRGCVSRRSIGRGTVLESQRETEKDKESRRPRIDPCGS